MTPYTTFDNNSSIMGSVLNVLLRLELSIIFLMMVAQECHAQHL